MDSADELGSSESLKQQEKTANELAGTSQSCGGVQSSMTSGQSLATSGSKSMTPSGEESASDQFYDDDFLTRAVSVAISKKGLST